MRKRDQPAVTELQTARDAVKREPSDPRHWISLGVVLLGLRHWSEAVKALKRGIELRPAYVEADARLFLAEALEGADRMAEARKQWQTVLAMEPCYPSYEEPMATARRKLARP
jgi:cytochrome c-type biogenesis protein CcmH/NrfG